MKRHKIDWFLVLASVFLGVVLFLLGLFSSAGILKWLGWSVTPVNSLLTGVFIALLFGFVIPAVIGSLLKKGRVEDNLRSFFRKETRLRWWLFVVTVSLTYVFLITGLFLSLIEGSLLTTTIIFLLTVSIFILFFLLLTLFPKVIIGVEGTHDIDFLKAISKALREYGQDVPDLAQLESVGDIVFIPVGGSSLRLWKSRLKVFGRPEFYIFDRDTEPPRPAKYQLDIDKFNSLPNCEAVSTTKREMENYLHPAAIKAARPEVDITFGDFDDVPSLVAEAMHAASDSPNLWKRLDKDKKDEKSRNAKRWLNTEAAAKMTPELLDERDPHGELRGWLKRIAQYLEE